MADSPRPPAPPSSVEGLAAHVLVVVPEEEAAAIDRALSAAGLSATLVRVSTQKDLEAALDKTRFDAAIIGHVEGLPFQVVQTTWRGRGLALSGIAFDRTFREEVMREVMNLGADDYITLEQLSRLPLAIVRELRRARVRPPTSPRLLDEGARSLLQAVMDALPFIVFVKDAEELRLVAANQTFADVFKVSKEWLIGKLDHEYFPKEQADAFNVIDREVLSTRKMKTFEEVARIDGVDRQISTRKLPISDSDGRLYLLGIAEDVTERKDAEVVLREMNKKLEANIAELKRSRAISAKTLASYQQRALQMEIIRQQNEDLDRLAQDLAKSKRLEEQRAREIEQAARLKSEFLANFSHEIRTPLNGIIGYCDLLMREEGSRLTPHGRRDLQVVKANARTLLALINDILDLSKIEAGHVEVVKESVDVAALVDECIATVRDYLQKKDVEVYANVAPEVKSLDTDGLKLRQILLNLLSNAAKFTETGEIVVDIKADGDRALIVVEDTGSGISADQLPFIFEKFRQVDGSSTRKVGGTGLGLAIVRELCKVLGGTVDVQSTLGRGTKFTIVLPNVLRSPDKTIVSTATITERTEKPTGATVLIVDDDPLVVHLLRAELEKEGMRVLVASDGVEALSMAKQHRPSAIVLDIHLPKLDGWTVITEIKSAPTLAHIPIIMLSIEEQRARGMSMGALEYLVKPVDAERLVAIVSRSVAPGTGEVLVVDDDLSTRELVSRQLRRAGFSTTEARDGEEALLRARVTNPGLIVLDLAMPGMNGFEVLRQMRAEQMNVPVVVLTGKVLSESEQQALRDGIAAIVQKNGSGIDQVIAEAKRLLVEQRKVAKAKLPRVLYVEDSAQNRDVVRRYLQGTFDILEAEDGEHGLDRAAREIPDLILMDLSLPRLDGWEATRRLKAGPLSSIPVVALTAHASREDQARARAAGCDGYLTKPVDRELLVSTIRKHLSTRQPPPTPAPGTTQTS